VKRSLRCQSERAVLTSRQRLANQFKALEVFLRPAGLVDHALQSLTREGAVPAVKDNGDPSTIGMIVDLVRPIAAVEAEPITDERGNEFAGAQIPKLGVIDAHGSESHCHPRFDGYLYLISRLIRNGFAVLKHAFHNHMNDIIDFL